MTGHSALQSVIGALNLHTGNRSWQNRTGQVRLFGDVRSCFTAACPLPIVAGGDRRLTVQVTCGVAAAVLGQVQDSLRGSLAGRGLSANIIVSGHGDWRWVGRCGWWEVGAAGGWCPAA
jgi:hypothetical protein